MTAKRLRLKARIPAIQDDGQKRTVMEIPEGSIIELVDRPRGDCVRLVDIKWNGRTLVAFVEDIQRQGVEVLSATS